MVNPSAGGGRAAEALPALRHFAKCRGWKLLVCVTESPEDLVTKARSAAASGTKRILVLGGDGTFQLLVNALAGFPETILGVIPAGGGNDLAASLGLPRDVLEAAALLLEGEIAEVDVVRVQTSEGNERLYTGGGGVGLDAEAATYASGVYRDLRGRLRYLLSAVRALVRFHSIPVVLTMSGSETRNLEATALLVGILNTPSYGAGLRLAPHAQTDDGCLDLVVLDDLSVLEVLALLPTLAYRGVLKTKHVRRFRIASVRIETRRPYRFHGDGEILGTTPVVVSVVPRAIRVLRAARKEAV